MVKCGKFQVEAGELSTVVDWLDSRLPTPFYMQRATCWNHRIIISMAGALIIYTTIKLLREVAFVSIL